MILACDNCAYSGSTHRHASHVKAGDPCHSCGGGRYVAYWPVNQADAQLVHDCLATVVTLMEQVGEIPPDAPLLAGRTAQATRERIARLAADYDHFANCL